MLKTLLFFPLALYCLSGTLSAQTKNNGLMVMISLSGKSLSENLASSDSMYTAQRLATYVGSMIRDYENYSSLIVKNEPEEFPLVKSIEPGFIPSEIRDLLILESPRFSESVVDSLVIINITGSFILYGVREQLVLTGAQFNISSLPTDKTPNSRMISVASQLARKITGTEKATERPYVDETSIEAQDEFLRMRFFGGFTRLFHLKEFRSSGNSGSNSGDDPSVAHYFADNSAFHGGVEFKLNPTMSIGYQFMYESMEGNGNSLIRIGMGVKPYSETLEAYDHYFFVSNRYLVRPGSKLNSFLRGGVHYKSWSGSGEFSVGTVDYEFGDNIGFELSLGLEFQADKNFGGQVFVGFEFASTSLEAIELNGVKEKLRPSQKLEDNRAFIGGRLYFDVYFTDSQKRLN